jgi:hypothetical protein
MQKIRLVVAFVATFLVTAGVIDAGQSDAVTAAFDAVVVALSAFHIDLA